MKLTKMDCTLNEQDTLQDMLESEKQLMELYRALRRKLEKRQKEFFDQSFRRSRKSVLHLLANAVARLLRAETRGKDYD